uniref:centrosomal protein of 135 kDa isoform X2 n=1 Tax=Anopheles coluzzii TaxID=1518534 RepID=UPI0020FF8A61|nr:centrosomal protein of 135 kDa isoform X2 [Anopheles coluzzii]
MDIEARHSELRTRLDVLGFGHPLPLSAIGIVSAILDDLIQTSEKLKCANQRIEQLHQEKSAWELGVEPYKCDNSRLLAECNALHLELIKQQDKHILANTELRSRVRSLQADKKQLEEKCLAAECKIRELQTGSSESVKSRKDTANKQRKPFISTVRAGTFYQPPKCCEQGGMQQPGGMPPTCRCPCNQMKQVDVLHEVERLRVETQNQQGVIDALKNQVNSRDREIQRLGALFAGGRPAAALAKDCCYRDVNELGHDVATLQQEKLSLQQTLTEAQQTQERTARKLSRLSEKNQQLEKELREFESAAIKLESEANRKMLEHDRKNSDLQVKLQQSQVRVRELESLLELCGPGAGKVRPPSDSSISSSPCPSDAMLQTALQQATDEKRLLYKQLNELKDREQSLLADFEKVKTKYTRLKQKHAALEQTQHHQPVSSSAEGQVELQSLQYRCSELEEKLRHTKQERDRYSSDAERQRTVVSQLKRESVEKDHELAELKNELHALRKSNRPSTASQGGGGRLRTADSHGSGQSSLSVQAAIHRIERERDAAKSEVRQLEQERDALREKLKLSTRSQQDAVAKHENAIAEYSGRVVTLEAEKRDLQGGQAAAQMKVKLLKEESRELQARVKELEESYSKLKLSYSQMKILHEQTERALAQHQHRLLSTETQLGTAESKLQRVDSTVEDAQNEVGRLKGEISLLRASNASLVREKDKLLMDLDKKTENLYAAEAEIAELKAKRKELKSTIDRMQQKLDNVSTDNIHKESTLRSVSTETDTLKQQMATLKRKNDNASTENGRLSNELTDALAELTLTKRQLKDSQQEVERMKTQLREYVQEMQRAEELLLEKERERESMLERFKSLSEGVNVLETSNHTLEAETSEARKLLQEAEERIATLEELTNEREQNIRECEHQINELSASLAAAESELEALREENKALALDLEATKELCGKLDLQKDKLQAELEEHSNIREQLAREKGTLQRELTLTRTGDRAAVDGLQELLTASRADLEQHRLALAQQQQETEKLRTEVDALRSRMADEQDKARRSEALASEYGVQLQELRRQLTDERFALMRSRAGESRTEREDIHHEDEGDDGDDDDCNRRYLDVANKARAKRSKEALVGVEIGKEKQNVQTMATQTLPAGRKQKRDSSVRTRATQKSEPKMVAPSGWKITNYERSASKARAKPGGPKPTDTDQSQGYSDDGCSNTSISLDGFSAASDAFTSLSYDIIDQPNAQDTGAVAGVAGASGIVKSQMDGTGSTVVIYKTDAGERLVLKHSPRPAVQQPEQRSSETNPPQSPFVRLPGTACDEAVQSQQHSSVLAAGRVMIIDEPSAGAVAATGQQQQQQPVTIDCNTTVTATASPGAETTRVVDTWAKILLQQSAGEGSSTGGKSVAGDGVLVPVMPSTNDVSVERSERTTTHNYHLRFHVKMPVPSSKPP